MNDGLVTIGTYATVFEADMVKGKLEAFGVGAVLEDRNMVGVNALLTNMLGGVKVRVPESQVEEALGILEAESAAEEDAAAEH